MKTIYLVVSKAFVLLFFFSVCFPALAQEENSSEKKDVKLVPLEGDMGRAAVLQILNKITAGNSVLKIRASESEKFGNLEIKIKDCWKSPPEEKPEAAVLMEVFEEKPGDDRKKIFHGWMFASSPGISALENPVYDVVVLNCAPWKQ